MDAGRRTVELGDEQQGDVVPALALEEALVAFVPGEAFGAPGYARFSFALGDADIERGLANLADLVANFD